MTSFSMRRVVVVTERIDPPIRNMQFRARLGGIPTYNDPFGLGSTEAEAVMDLYSEIAFREDKAEQQHEGTEV